MLRLSTKGRYATRFMLDLALNYGKGNTLLKDIAKRQDISEGYLEHLVSPLKAAGLIIATRGSRGGYMLAKPPSEITVKDVVYVVEGAVCPAECVDNFEICERSAYCVTREIWKELGEKICATLESYTLKDLVEREKEISKGKIVYHI